MIKKPEQFYDSRRKQHFYKWEESEHAIRIEPLYDGTIRYIKALESENADLRELASKCMSALRGNGISLAEYEVLEGMCYALGVEYE